MYRLQRRQKGEEKGVIREDFLEKLKFEMNIQGQVRSPQTKKRQKIFEANKEKRWEEWVGDEAVETETGHALLCEPC